MTRQTAIRLLIAQSLLAIALFWAVLYLGRDEFRLAVEHDAPAIPSGAEVGRDDDGPPVVRLSAAAQRNVGIELAVPQAVAIGPLESVQAVVVDAHPLLEARARLLAARLDLEAASTTAAASGAEARRLRALYADDRNASQRSAEAAEAQASLDATRRRAAEVTLAGARSAIRLAWGATVSAWVEAVDGAALTRLADGRDALLRVALRPGSEPGPSTELQITRPGDARPENAVAVGIAAGDAATGSRGALFRTNGAGLAPGQRLAAWLGLRAGAPTQAPPGVIVPASAVVWHEGQAWMYVVESGPAPATRPASASAAAAPRDDDDAPAKPAWGAAQDASTAKTVTTTAATTGAVAFQRRALLNARRIGDDWFFPTADTDDRIVVRGAQLLLSEEQRSLIKNENDD